MPGKVRDASDVGFDGVRRSVAYTQVVDHALTKSSHGKLLSERKCSFGDKHYALLKGAFYSAKNGKDEVENLQQCSAAYRVAVLSNRVLRNRAAHLTSKSVSCAPAAVGLFPSYVMAIDRTPALQILGLAL